MSTGTAKKARQLYRREVRAAANDTIRKLHWERISIRNERIGFSVGLIVELGIIIGLILRIIGVI